MQGGTLVHPLKTSTGEAFGRFADRWWPVGLILFGALFIFGIPSK
jgi:hypothetical protein